LQQQSRHYLSAGGLVPRAKQSWQRADNSEPIGAAKK
jgi:hypothetical protein